MRRVRLCRVRVAASMSAFLWRRYASDIASSCYFRDLERPLYGFCAGRECGCDRKYAVRSGAAARSDDSLYAAAGCGARRLAGDALRMAARQVPHAHGRSASLVSHDASGAESPGGEDAEQEAAPVLPREHGAAHGEHEMYSGGGEHFESLAAWLERMPQEQQVRARAIMEEFFPRLRHLKHQLRAKMRELQVLTYGRETDPQALPALGQELQRLRRQLGQELTSMNHALIREVGSPLPFPPGRGYSSLSRAVPE